MDMVYQIKERPIFSESDLLHFGETEQFGDQVNTHFPDYCGINVGSVIYQSDDKNEADSIKNKLETNRMKALNEMLIAFFDDDKRANSFYTSDEFTKLQELYQQEFTLKLVRLSHNQMEVVGKGFYLPIHATDEQIAEIQTLLNVYFFTIQSVPIKQQSMQSEIDWDARYAILFPNTSPQNKIENEVESNLGNGTNDHSESLIEKTNNSLNTDQSEGIKKQRPWWKFW